MDCPTTGAIIRDLTELVSGYPIDRPVMELGQIREKSLLLEVLRWSSHLHQATIVHDRHDIRALDCALAVRDDYAGSALDQSSDAADHELIGAASMLLVGSSMMRMAAQESKVIDTLAFGP